MNIAMLHTPIIRRGGGIRQLLMLARGLSGKGHKVKIYTPQVSPDDTFTDLLAGLDIEEVNRPLPPELESGPLRYYGDLVRMKAMGLSVSAGFDIINPHNFPTEWAARFAKARHSAPVVWMCNEPPYFFGDVMRPEGAQYILEWPLFAIWDCRAVAESVDKIVALSDNAASLVERAYGLQAEVVRSGTDAPIRDTDKAQARRATGAADDDFICVQVGFVTPHKRMETTLRAIAGIRDKRVRAVFVGEGAIDKYRKLAAELNISDRALFTGSIPDESLAQHIAAADVFLYPAGQTWGLAAAEAMAAGLPVIASLGNGFSEIIEPGVTGYTFEPGDISALGAHIEYLFHNQPLCRKMGEQAKQYVKDNLSWRRYVDRMEDIFEETIRNHRGAKKKTK